MWSGETLGAVGGEGVERHQGYRGREWGFGVHLGLSVQWAWRVGGPDMSGDTKARVGRPEMVRVWL